MISRYRMALMQVVDLCCILLALAVSGMVTIAPDLSVFDDYTGASLFTIFFYLLFFYILDAYSVGMEDSRTPWAASWWPACWASSARPRRPSPWRTGASTA